MCILYTYKYNANYPSNKLIPIGMFEPYIKELCYTNADTIKLTLLSKRLIEKNEI